MASAICDASPSRLVAIGFVILRSAARQARAGDTARAKATFDAIAGQGGTGDLARLWLAADGK